MPPAGAPQRASSATPALAPGACWRREFPGQEQQLGVLRRWLASLLPPCPARDDVITVADELSSNAILHTRSGHGGRFTIEVTWHGAVVRVAVADSGAPAGPRETGDPGSEHGRGLVVVRGLSARMGACGDHRGRLAWADVPWAGTPAAVAAALPAGQEAVIRDGEAAPARRFAGVPCMCPALVTGSPATMRCALAWPGAPETAVPGADPARARAAGDQHAAGGQLAQPGGVLTGRGTSGVAHGRHEVIARRVHEGDPSACAVILTRGGGAGGSQRPSGLARGVLRYRPLHRRHRCRRRRPAVTAAVRVPPARPRRCRPGPGR